MTATKMTAYTFPEVFIATKNEVADIVENKIIKFVVVAETFEIAKNTIARAADARFGPVVIEIDFGAVFTRPIDGAMVIDTADVED